MSEGLASARPSVLLLQSHSEESSHVKQALNQNGYEVAGPFRSVTAVYEYIENHEPDLAILDNSTGDAAFELAAELQRRDIPFIFYATWGDVEGIPPEFREAAFLEKPVSAVLLTKIVCRIIQRRASIQREMSERA
jgi:DNA-binding NtrC family response regulator